MKKILAAVTAILMLSAMTACGNDGNSAEVTNETTSAAARDEISAETQAENNAETDEETEAAEAETEAAEVDDDLYSGNGYTIKVDSAKWMDASEYIELISKYAEDTNFSQSLTAEDIQSMSDGMFYHANEDGTNFNIVCNPIGNTDGINIGDGAELMKEQYAAAGITWLGSEVAEINGVEWLKIDVETSMSGTDMKMLQCMALANGNQYVLTYTADTDKYNDALSDFEEVLNSFKIAE